MSHDFLHLTPGPSPGREGVAAHRVSAISMRQPIKKTSRVPRYQNIKIIDGYCDYFFKPLPWNRWSSERRAESHSGYPESRQRKAIGQGQRGLGLGLKPSWLGARLCRLLPSGRKKVGWLGIKRHSLGELSAKSARLCRLLPSRRKKGHIAFHRRDERTIATQKCYEHYFNGQ